MRRDRIALIASSLTAMLFVANSLGGELQTFRNSPALTEVTSLNDQGVILGRHETEVAGGGVLSMESYLRVDGTDRAVPIPDDFTHVEPQFVTNSGHVVGFATRPAGHPEGNQRAFVWAIDNRVAELLPLPDTFRGSCAFDSSQDAQRVCGYVLGRDPPRMIPCVWDQGPAGWTCQLLPVWDRFNPLLTSARVVMSDDGQTVVASLVIAYAANQTRLYGLFRWRQDEAGQWQREELLDQAIHLGDVNDAGFIAGRILESGQHRAFVYDPTRGPQVLPLPEGRQTAYATDVNRFGQVVGVAEDPPGPEGTMSAFLWYQGKLRELPFGVAVVASTANTITDEGQVGGLLARGDATPENTTEDAAVESYVLKIDLPSD